jgi:hypothetical protein
VFSVFVTSMPAPASFLFPSLPPPISLCQAMSTCDHTVLTR